MEQLPQQIENAASLAGPPGIPYRFRIDVRNRARLNTNAKTEMMIRKSQNALRVQAAIRAIK